MLRPSGAADKLEISEATVEGLLNGGAWPDLVTIARVDGNHRVAQWPHQHSPGSD